VEENVMRTVEGLRGRTDHLRVLLFRENAFKVLLMKRLFLLFILVAPMKNLYQQTCFDFPMPTIKFLYINYSGINKH